MPFKLQFNQNGCGERNALIIFHASFSKRRANGRFTSHLGVISLSASYPTSSAVGTYSSRGRTYIYGRRNKRTAGSTLSSTHRPTDSEPRNGGVAVAPVFIPSSIQHRSSVLTLWPRGRSRDHGRQPIR